MINLEIFSCAGGMAEGFRRAGIEFDMGVDFAADHCDSYERNLGHRPIRMDARDLLRMVTLGWRVEIDLLVADPPCTPWSRAGKRLGTSDERDMLEVTCDLIAALRPRRYLIGNVPGLDDTVNLPIVQRVIGGLSAHGYCTADFARLDAADYGVPQHRVRPFWFGHREGPCLVWPAPTHGDPTSASVCAPTLAGFANLKPWVTCRDALGHLSVEQMGRAVRMRRREQNGHQLGSVAERPARVVGTSNLSDGNVLSVSDKHPPLTADSPATTVRGGGEGHAAPALVLSYTPKHPPSFLDEPAMTAGAKMRGQGAEILLVGDRKKRPPSTKGPQSTRVDSPDAPSMTVQARADHSGSGSPVLDWPWSRPSTTVTARPGLPPPGHHDEDFAIMSLPDAIQLGEIAAVILQGFPEDWVFSGATKKARWSQIGQAVPPAVAAAVARSVVDQDRKARS